MQILPLADQITAGLQTIWASAGGDYILKQSILGILSRLVTSLQSESSRFHHVLAPVIRSSVDRSSELSQYLLEDALELWNALVENSTSPPSEEVAGLVDGLLQMFDSGSDVLRKALDITKAYIYLMPTQILASPSLLLSPFTTLLSNSKKEICGIATHLVELLIQSAHKIGGVSAVESLTAPLISSSFLPSVLMTLKDCYEANQTTGPNAIHPPIDGIIETDYFSVMGRLGVTSPLVLTNTFEKALRGSSMDWLIKEWFAHMDNMSSPEQKKLSGMALTGLLDGEAEWILPYLQNFMSMWTDLVTELVYETEDSAGNLMKVDCFIFTPAEQSKPNEPEYPWALRERQMKHADPIHQIDIRDLIREKLGSVVARSGGPKAFEERWVQTLDQDVVRAFGELGIL